MAENESLDVLLVEDDSRLREMLEFHLRAQGWSVRSAEDGLRAIEACDERVPDVVILDVMLPGCDGIEVCRTLRRKHFLSTGVVMLTARDAEIDVVLGFEVGADDYVVKPCRPRELIARVRALARRVVREPDQKPRAEVLDRGRLSID
jgi:two-component system alkaline phosphatase synthesis response regulator PhoP